MTISGSIFARMRYHIRVEAGRQGEDSIYGVNLTESTARERFLNRYERGLPITWDGKTIPPSAITSVRVRRSNEEVPTQYPSGMAAWNQAAAAFHDVTNDVVTGPVGGFHAPSPADREPGVERDPRRVMVVLGRNSSAVDAMVTFLRSLGLEPILWEDAVEEIGLGSPHNLDVLTHLGRFRGASDVDGLNAVRLDSSAQRRAALRRRLASAGCVVDDRDHYLNPRQARGFRCRPYRCSLGNRRRSR